MRIREEKLFYMDGQDEQDKKNRNDEKECGVLVRQAGSPPHFAL